MALHQRDDAGGSSDKGKAALCDDGAEPGAPAHATGRVPPWTEQLTLRGLVVSVAVGTMYSVIVMKLNLTTGLNPTLNVSAALISFVMLRGWTQALARLGRVVRPLTRQENTVVQTCAVACYSIGAAGRDRARESLPTFLSQVEHRDSDAFLDFPFCAPQAGSGPTCSRSTRPPTRWPGRRRRATCQGATRSPALRG